MSAGFKTLFYAATVVVIATIVGIAIKCKHDPPTAMSRSAWYRSGSLQTSTAALFEGKSWDSSSQLRLWDGSRRTASGHMDWLLTHVKETTAHDAPGFRVTGSHNGVEYGLHDNLTATAAGAGYFRLKAEISTSPELLTALMMDAPAISQMDATVRAMDFFTAFDEPDVAGKTWLVYWRASPSAFLLDIDGFDISGFRKEADGTVYQISISVPDEIPHASYVSRGMDLYWGYRLEPLKNGKTRLTLICQTELNNIVPKGLANSMIGDVLADYVRTAEMTAIKYTADGKADALLKRYGLVK